MTPTLETPMVPPAATRREIAESINARWRFEWGSRLSRHWPEYLMECCELGLFMVSACLFGILLYSPDSPLATGIPNSMVRQLLMGLAMGLTHTALVHSPWGKQSGAHMNPAVTLTFYRLGRIDAIDAGMYMVAQTAGGLAGVFLLLPSFARWLRQPEVNFVVTVPGPDGPVAAWLVEFAIAGLLMYVVLAVSNHPRWARWTGICASTLVASYIALTAQFSGMSMNPARTFASAVPSGIWTSFWIYLTAPLLAMLLAARLYVGFGRRRSVFCAKLHHQNARRCIFCQQRAAQVAN